MTTDERKARERLGFAFSKARKELGLSVNEMSARTKICRETINRMETLPHLDGRATIKMCVELGVDPREFVGSFRVASKLISDYEEYIHSPVKWLNERKL